MRDATTDPQHEIRNPVRLLMHVPVPWVFVLTYLAGLVVERTGVSFKGSNLLHGTVVVGGALFGVGVVIAGWAQWLFRKARTTTVPGQRSASLVTSGPYRFTRNPMYVGLTLAYLGEAGMLRQLWPIVLLPLTIAYLNWVVIPVEEGRLHEVFGQDYARYRARVRRWA
jgi:protein-S-isoprenylcysteine O-methyltransferase Ste14